MVTSYLLTGDIGGTNSRMGLYLVGNNTPLFVKTYRNLDFFTKKEAGIFENNVIGPFLKTCWETVPNMTPIELSEIIACLAIAGPVKNNKVIMSNLHDIEICGDTIVESEHACHYLKAIQVCKIINDFVAQGYGCLTLQEHEVVELTPGALSMLDPSGPKACVGAGTGLGECFLTPDEHGLYSCFPSEGGHVEWAPRSDLEVKMWRFFKEKFCGKHRVSVERVVSGTGLANCYEFLAYEFPKKVDKKVHKEFLEAGDLRGKVVAVNSKTCELCELAMSTMITSYGSEVGSVGIKLIPTGGLYVTGGLTPKNIDWIKGKDSHFMTAYYDKGRVSSILNNVPLLAVMVEDLGVRGATKNAQIEFEKWEARKTAVLNRNATSYVDLDSVVMRGENVSIRVEEAEKEASFFKTIAQISIAFSVGLVADRKSVV